METIVIATDFSEASRNASFYGTKLAGLLDAKVVLLNAYSFVGPAADVVINGANEELRRSSKEGLRHEVGWLNLKGTIEIEKRSVQGDAAEVVLREAQKIKATWIVAGMKGAGKMARKMFGGTAFSLSRHSEIPLILVPENAWFTPPKTIALASDINHETDMHVLDPLEEFGLKCNANMFIVRVIKKGMDEMIERLLRPSRVKWHCKDLNPSFEFLNDNNVAHAMNTFVKEHDVDMIAMISQEHTFFERIFEKSDIKEMILLADVPLIILPGTVQTKYIDKTSQGVGKTVA